MEAMHYRNLLVMAVLSFLAMYALMYAMVDAWENVLSNVNQVYMAGLMAAPMVIIELIVMRAMYRNRTAGRRSSAAGVPARRAPIGHRAGAR